MYIKAQEKRMKIQKKNLGIRFFPEVVSSPFDAESCGATKFLNIYSIFTTKIQRSTTSSRGDLEGRKKRDSKTTHLLGTQTSSPNNFLSIVFFGGSVEIWEPALTVLLL